ncbi:MAG: HEPN domain-containing protein [Chloroflexi bacterium]|nr:HEPN domain-containing protein [Chloroflexota bacterium]
MTNRDLVLSRLSDARSFLKYATGTLEEGRFHHTVQFAQRTAELAVKALLSYEGKDVPDVHDLARMVNNLAVVRALPPEQQRQFYRSNRELARERLTAIYGSDEGVPLDAMYDRAAAEKALEQGRFVLSTAESLIASSEEV